MTEGSLRPEPVCARATARGRLGVAFGQRTFLLLGIGLIAVGPAFWNPRYLWAMVLWDLLVLALWTLDLARLPAARDIELRRDWSSAAAHGCVQELKLTLLNHGRQPMEVRLLDEVAPELRLQPPSGRLSVERQSWAEFRYRIRPTRRGDIRMGQVYLTCQSRLRLAERWLRAGLGQTVRVLPNLEAARLHSLYLLRGRGLQQERRRVRRPGQGREFDRLREYRPGDEFRDICWSATARRLKPVTRTWQLERNQPVWIVLDTGRLLRARAVKEAGEPTGRLFAEGDDAVPPPERTRLDYAVDAALALAQVALHSGDQVGLLAYGRDIRARILPGRGPAHLRQLIDQLSLLQPEPIEADHLLATGRLLQMQKRRSLVVWITDMAETAMTPEVIEGAAHLRKHHLVLFVALGQTELMRLAAERPAGVEQMYRITAAQEILLRREQLLARLAGTGVLALQTTPGGLSTLLLSQYLDLKERES